jgi:hypothetical protein
MYMVFYGLGGLLFLVGFICWLITVIKAFKMDTTQGILSLCIWPYSVYFGFAKMDSPKKTLIALGNIGGYVGGWALYFIGGMMMASAAMGQVNDMSQMYQQQMQQMGTGMPGMTGFPMTGMPMTGFPMTPFPGTTQ